MGFPDQQKSWPVPLKLYKASILFEIFENLQMSKKIKILIYT